MFTIAILSTIHNNLSVIVVFSHSSIHSFGGLSEGERVSE
jgi:hypothetical protein